MYNDLMLAVETSTRRGSVALGRGRDVLGWRALSVEQTHTTELLPTIRALLAEARVAPPDVSIVAFSQGPGSFTGLRVAATLARTWQSATGCRVVAVPTMAVIARNALTHPDRPHRGAVIQDAKRGQLLAGLFERDGEGEFKDAFDPALSSSPRVKTHYRGRSPKKRCGTRDAFACNEALLLLHALAFNLANVGREGLEHATRCGWTIRSFREHLLKTPARVLLHARRAVVVINDIAAYYWQCLGRFLATLRPQPIAARAP